MQHHHHSKFSSRQHKNREPSSVAQSICRNQKTAALCEQRADFSVSTAARYVHAARGHVGNQDKSATPQSESRFSGSLLAIQEDTLEFSPGPPTNSVPIQPVLS